MYSLRRHPHFLACDHVVEGVGEVRARAWACACTCALDSAGQRHRQRGFNDVPRWLAMNHVTASGSWRKKEREEEEKEQAEEEEEE